MHRHRGGPRRGAELVAQQHPQLLERAQRLGRVAGRLVHLHQQPVRGLAERRGGDRRARRLLCGAELAAALAQPGLGERLERAHAHGLQLAPALVDPRAVAVGEERLQVDDEHLARRLGGRGPVAGVDRRLGGDRGRGRDLDVDLDRPGRHEAQLGAAGERSLAERAAQLRQQRAERGLGRDGRALRPQQVDQLGPAAVTIAVEDEVREQQPTLAPGKSRPWGLTSPVHSHRPAQPYRPPLLLTHSASTLPRRQGFSKVSPTGVPQDSGRGDGKEVRRRGFATWMLRKHILGRPIFGAPESPSEGIV